MSSPWNLDSALDAKVRTKLERDLIAWLVTIAPDGTPRSVPVWFFWDGERLMIVSEPGTHKVAAIRRGAPVLLHLEAGGPYGDDVVILHGRAEIAACSAGDWLAENAAAYTEKYAAAIDDYGMPLEEIAQKFSTLIAFTPERVQAW